MDSPQACGGRSAAWLFVVCSSCSGLPSFSICRVFEFWLGKVSEGPRVPGRQSAGAWRVVCVLPADGPFFGVRFWRFCWLWTVRGPGRMVRCTCADSPQYIGGQSAWLVRTVRPSWPDGPPEPRCFVPWIDSSFLSCFRVCFKESFLRLEVDP
jgi:hypothetical protein